MQKEALYQKYRSQTFDELVGQQYVVRSIKNAVQEGKVGHAYLFCGPRGTGKTSMARLLARAVNCEDKEHAPCGKCENCLAAIEGTHPDIIEINAANETHVEDVRDLIERARLSPMMGQHKVYIVDEVHQLSSSAASALLKTLEEPPEHVIFILATTDPQKLLPTIISRCQRFDFSKIKNEDIKNHLLDVANKEGVTLEEEAAEKLAILADGGMRDSLSMLEQAIAYTSGNITNDAINEIYGLASVSEKIKFLKALHEKDIQYVLEHIEMFAEKGIDFKRLTSDLVSIIKDAVIYDKTQKESLLRILNAEEASLVIKLSDNAFEEIDLFMEAMEMYRSAQSVVNVFEIACLKITCMNDSETKVSVLPKIEKKVIKTEPKQVEIEAEQEPVVETFIPKIEEPELDKETVLRILVQCDKDNKSRDIDIINDLLNALVMNKYIAALRQITLKASGRDCILFSTPSQAVFNTLNEKEMNKELYFFLKEAGIDKVPYIALDKVYSDAVNEFVQKRKTNSLPSALPIVRYTIEIKEEKKGETPDTETRLKNLFGDDLEVYD